MRNRLMAIMAALLCVFFVASCGAKPKEVKQAASGIVARHMSDGLGDITPDADVWNDTPEMIVAMLPQDLAEPKLEQPTLSEIRVKALSDNQNVAFRIEWEDPSQNTIDSGNQFSDAVAVQLPTDAGGTVPAPTMGQTDKPVNIQLWKASYEGAKDMESWTLQQTYPNATVDHYPFKAAKEGESEKLTKQYTIALAAGNPIDRNRDSSVDDLQAHGFGTLTHLPLQASKGWSRWQNGRWAVVISRPLAEPEWPGGEGFSPGQNTFVAFAVWDGGSTQVGSRKMRSVWVPLEIGGGS